VSLDSGAEVPTLQKTAKDGATSVGFGVLRKSALERWASLPVPKDVGVGGCRFLLLHIRRGFRELAMISHIPIVVTQAVNKEIEYVSRFKVGWR
jgi:hypothetical protein